jgi:7-cyano-7-deazaguanine synthase
MALAERNAVVLLSGGLDSATALAVARLQGYTCHALSISYGQRHHVELAAAARVAKALGVAGHKTLTLDLRLFGGSALTADIPVPHGRGLDSMANDIPATYVPARNTIFLSLALAYAETIGSFNIFAGMNALDYSGYPDCRPEYLASFEAMANLATKDAVEGKGRYRIHAPLLRLGKADIIRLGSALGVDYGLTHSCYDPTPQGRPCGTCDSCQLRLKGFEEAGMADPVMTAP